MKNYSGKDESVLERVRPLLDQDSHEIQPYGRIARLPRGRQEVAVQQ